MNQETVRRYAPLVLVFVIQVFLVVAGSRGDAGISDTLLAGGVGAPGVAAVGGPTAPGVTPAGGSVPGTGGAVVPGQVSPGSGGLSASGGSGTAAGSGTTGSGGSGGAGPVTTVSAGATGERDFLGRPISGDRSKCAGLLQEDITLQSPPCMPYIDDSNPGATWQGVTADEVKIVIMYDEYDPAIQTALAANGLAMDPAQAEEINQIYEKFFNDRYEFHGRKINFEYYYSAGDDAVTLRADAKEIKELHNPFAVVQYAQSTMPSAIADQLAREGVLAIGVGPLDDSFFIDRHPFVWTAAVQGNWLTDATADYFCKKMYGKNATLAGDPLMRVQPRKLGVGAIEEPLSMSQANRFIGQVTGGMCGEPADFGTKVLLYTQSADADTRADQHPALVQRMKEDGITTAYNLAVCAEGDEQQYFPEGLISTPVDDDFVGRLFAGLCSPNQFNNVFGVGAYVRNQPEENKEKHTAAKAVNPDYEPPYLADGMFQGMIFAARLIQYAGPNLTPQTVYEGAQSMHQIAGWVSPDQPWEGWTCCNPYVPEHNTAITSTAYASKADLREIYWDHSAQSEGDGAPGAWVGVDGSKRWRPGSFPSCEPKVACPE